MSITLLSMALQPQHSGKHLTSRWMQLAVRAARADMAP